MALVKEEWKNKEFWWNDSDRKTEVLLEKTGPSASLSITNPGILNIF